MKCYHCKEEITGTKAYINNKIVHPHCFRRIKFLESKKPRGRVWQGKLYCYNCGVYLKRGKNTNEKIYCKRCKK